MAQVNAANGPTVSQALEAASVEFIDENGKPGSQTQLTSDFYSRSPRRRRPVGFSVSITVSITRWASRISVSITGEHHGIPVSITSSGERTTRIPVSITRYCDPTQLIVNRFGRGPANMKEYLEWPSPKLPLPWDLPKLDNNKASIETLVRTRSGTCWASRRCSRPKTPTNTTLC